MQNVVGSNKGLLLVVVTRRQNAKTPAVTDVLTNEQFLNIHDVL